MATPHRHAGIAGPQDLAGKTIGEFGVYGQDSGVWAKGILADDYGFRPEANRWVVGGLDAPSAPFGFVPQIRPDGIDIAQPAGGHGPAGLWGLLNRGGGSDRRHADITRRSAG